MPRLAIIDPVVSAGGVERFLHGLIGGAIQERITEKWEIAVVRNCNNSARRQVPWPSYLQAPGLQLRYFANDNAVSRCLNRLSSAHRLLGIPGTGLLQRSFAALLRSVGPDRWRAYCGEARTWIENYCRRNRFDVVYFSYPYYFEPPRLDVPMIATPHDFTFRYGLSTTDALSRRLDEQMKLWLKACSQVVVSSEFVAGDLRRFYPEWAHKTRVIRLGIPSVEHEPTQEQVKSYRQRKALPERFVLVAGWVTEHKNQQVVFEAVAKLRDQGVRIPVLLVGPNADILNEKSGVKAGDYAFRILQFCKQAGLRNGADYFSLGFVADFELECLYRCATALVVPTITEAGSFPAREAMRAGCPVAYSNIPVFQEEAGLLENNAWMFPAYDSCALAEIIREIANDPEKTRLRARAAQRLVNSVFCWRKTARGYFSIFEQLARTEQS